MDYKKLRKTKLKKWTSENRIITAARKYQGTNHAISPHGSGRFGTALNIKILFASKKANEGQIQHK